MKLLKQPWVLALATVTLTGVFWIATQNSTGAGITKIEASFEKRSITHLDHSGFFTKQFDKPQDVTIRCLECHKNAAQQIMQTSHWKWLGAEVTVPGHDGKTRIGKRNLINNFCIAIKGNWESCTRCHAGYGWKDENFDFDKQANVDCLVCHDWTGSYLKGSAGLPRKGVDLLAAAKGVGYPRRDNCGVCHHFGGGGLGVKHGDLDNSLDNPTEMDDVHMGRHKFLCIDCHKTKDHFITGRSMSVGVERSRGIGCDDCHDEAPHNDARLNSHIDSVACQTCHIPSYAKRIPTKVNWDWSKAGDDSRKDDTHSYLKIKGEFIYDNDIVPEYAWYNGTNERYLFGDPIDPSKVTSLNTPHGDINDPNAKIHPFKIHTGKQPYDTVNNRLAQPVTSGKGGYWHEFDWNKALKLGGEITGLEFSGKYGFAETTMHWPLSHMVTPAKEALSCNDCHSEHSRFDWKALGYKMDPIVGGGR